MCSDPERFMKNRHGGLQGERRKTPLRTANVSQPPPTQGEGTPIWNLVIEDMQERDRIGRKRYGVPLRTLNGRDPLVRAYHEALDLAVYLRQAIEER